MYTLISILKLEVYIKQTDRQGKSVNNISIIFRKYLKKIKTSERQKIGVQHYYETDLILLITRGEKTPVGLAICCNIGISR